MNFISTEEMAYQWVQTSHVPTSGTVTALIFNIAGVRHNSTSLIAVCSSYASVIIVMTAGGIFSAALQRDSSRSKIIHAGDKLTFEIYLIHVLLKLLFGPLHFNPFRTPAYLPVILLIAVLVFIMSGFTVLVLRMNRTMRKYL